jgi:hypothetical protein
MNARDRIELLHNRLAPLGIAREDTAALRRISMTLSRWSELECGSEHGAIERDETTGVPYWYNANASYVQANDPRCYTRVADLEAGALKRLERIAARYPELATYYQTDPRGAALYVGRKADMAVCYTHGVAVMP